MTAISIGSTITGFGDSYIPQPADSADIQVALKALYFGNTGGASTSPPNGIYGALYTLYSGNPILGGNVSVTGTLGVTGATTLSSTLAVTGNTTLTGDLAVNGGDITSTSATLNIGQTATTTSTINLGTAVNANGVTKTLNIGTSGALGSITNINIGAGTTYQASTINLQGKVVFQSGLASTPINGLIENDSYVFNGTTTAGNTQRGVIPTSFYYSTNSSNTLSNTGGAQSIFGTSGPANGILLKAGYTYEVEIYFSGTCQATTSASLQFLSYLNGGSQTLFSSAFKASTTPATLEGRTFGSISAVSNITSANTGTNFMAMIVGKMSITTDTLWLPQLAFSNYPGAGGMTTSAGTYVKVTPIGANTTPLNVGAWS
jgi:hypothetical protein